MHGWHGWMDEMNGIMDRPHHQHRLAGGHRIATPSIPNPSSPPRTTTNPNKPSQHCTTQIIDDMT